MSFFSEYFPHRIDQSCGNWSGLTVGKIAKPSSAGTPHGRKYSPTLRTFTKSDRSAFVGFVVFGDALQRISQSKPDISIATASATILSGPLSTPKQP
jgi:hypothetical protein